MRRGTRLQDRWLWTLRQTYEPGTGATIRAEAARLRLRRRCEAVDAYTADQRVIGNSLIAEARSTACVSTCCSAARRRARGAGTTAPGDLVLSSTCDGDAFSLAVVARRCWLGGLLTVLVLRSILVPLRRLVVAIEGVSRGDTRMPCCRRPQRRDGRDDRAPWRCSARASASGSALPPTRKPSGASWPTRSQHQRGFCAL